MNMEDVMRRHRCEATYFADRSYSFAVRKKGEPGLRKGGKGSFGVKGAGGGGQMSDPLVLL